MKYKILAVHNKYLIPGGEDTSFKIEVELLRSNGHEVVEYLEDNSKVHELGMFRTAFKTIWSFETYRKIQGLCKKHCIDVVCTQNFFPLISPSIYYAASSLKIPIVQYIRNYRLTCVNGLLYRNGKSCNRCVGKTLPYYGVLFGCYRNSRLASIVVASMIGFHRIIGTWTKKVTAYIALTEFAKQKLISSRIPKNKIFVKPNFIGESPRLSLAPSKTALYVGRISSEKGIQCMINAWNKVDTEYQLRIIGDGPLLEHFKKSTSNKTIHFEGRKPSDEITEIMKSCAFLIFPSECYEGMPRTIIEAFSVRLPVISSNIGAMSTMITDFKNGLHFEVGNVEDLSNKIREIIHDDALRNKIGENGHKDFRKKYTEHENYKMLYSILSSVIQSSK
ncbi:glycosyltransferase family 4 protein [Reichenbachiella sp.]|uniref:glycosyltransferase family 4 protein n=1 Tax=Reichenbachiella sp. TaxID=2184521 RepID=UPI003B5CC16F